MSTHITKEQFAIIYQETYAKTLRYIIRKCNNLEDVNDILQDTYVELYQNLHRKNNLKVESLQNYIFGITNNKMKKYYQKKKEIKMKIENELEQQNSLVDEFNLEDTVITKENVEEVWTFVQKKGLITEKIFSLYYLADIKISEIADDLNLKPSNVKNHLYRTLKEIQEKFRKGGKRK